MMNKQKEAVNSKVETIQVTNDIAEVKIELENVLLHIWHLAGEINSLNEYAEELITKNNIDLIIGDIYDSADQIESAADALIFELNYDGDDDDDD